MMKILHCILLIIFSIGFGYSLSFNPSAEAVLVMNAENGRVLFEKNGFVQKSPASTTKIATAFFTLHHMQDALEKSCLCDAECLFTVTHEKKEESNFSIPAYFLDPKGTHYYLKEGEALKLKDLLYGLMLRSGNDAANVIAKNVSGSIPKFISELNDFLREIGCTKTHFTNPHGLFHPEHLTTAYDLALMTKEALKIPLFREIISCKSYLRPKTNKQQSILISQPNPLLKEGGKFYYPNAFGVKTGFTKDSGYCFVAAAEGSGRTLIAVVLNCKEESDRYRDVISLFDLVFAEKKVARRIFKWDETQFVHNIKKSSQPLKATIMENIDIEYFPSEEPTIATEIVWHAGALPIKAGEIVGELRIIDKDENKVIKTAQLHALYPVKMSLFYRCLEPRFLFLLIVTFVGIMCLTRTRD
jgi:D-alanyl-D-alanine carboxypeptidase (penicillin-binding protein 5/6)